MKQTQNYRNHYFPLILAILWMACNTHSVKPDTPGQDESSLEKIKALNSKAAQLNPDSTNIALTAAHEAYLIAIRENDQLWQGKSMLNLSEGYLYNDSYDQAMQYAFKALDLFQAINDSAEIINSWAMLGWIFYDTENPTLSMNYHKQVYDWNIRNGQPKDIARSMNALGLVYQMIANNDSALYYFQNTFDISKKHQLAGLMSAAQNNTGICENSLGNYSKAVLCFEDALKAKDTSDDDLAIAEILNQMAFSYLKMKNYKKADSLLSGAKMHINNASSNTRKEKLADNLGIYAQLYREQGNYAKAYASLKELADVENEITNRNKRDVVTAQYLKRESQKSEDKINELKVQRELRLFQRNALGIVIILLIVIAFLWYSRLRNKRKREKELDEFKEVMLQKDLENSLKEKSVLNEKLEYKNSSLKNYALYVSHTNELQRNFIRDLSALSAKVEKRNDIQSQYNKLLRNFLNSIEQNKEEQGFNLSLDEANSDFFYNLFQQFPDLTKNEQRLCAQIRLNLSSKEIASFNNISVKSVEMARYRLRKHFRLQPKDDLTNFIQNF